eukprot:gb/GECG01001114.1/.p1 GENE.gb/GECG01001114.1/~~gb/GECG01001114.1/.p1  ORF type:complete len:106 (+),score=10.50 gb/GECG01001114.1/:1-318(+)
MVRADLSYGGSKRILCLTVSSASSTTSGKDNDPHGHKQHHSRKKSQLHVHYYSTERYTNNQFDSYPLGKFDEDSKSYIESNWYTNSDEGAKVLHEQAQDCPLQVS